MRRTRIVMWLPAAIGLAMGLAACSGMGPTTFLHPEYNFGYVERVAVVPFEDLSSDQGAGARATRFFVSELLATEAFDVVEPGEVNRALLQAGVINVADITQEQVVAVGQALGAQALFMGSVGESASVRTGASSASVVTLTARMVETDTGVTVWSATHTESGRSLWSSLFGTGQRSRSEVTRKAVEKTIKTLVN